MRGIVIALKYAKGLFLAGKELGKFKEFGEDLKKVLDLLEKVPEALSVLQSPIYPPDFKMEILDEILKQVDIHEEVRRFLRLLVEKRRIYLIKEIVEVYQSLVDEELGIVKGEVISVFPLEESELSQLQEALKEVLGKEVRLAAKQDEGIVGGLMVKIGDYVFDGSVKTQLKKFKEIIKGEVL